MFSAPKAAFESNNSNNSKRTAHFTADLWGRQYHIHVQVEVKYSLHTREDRLHRNSK